MWNNIESILDRMSPISLDEMSGIRLMDRIDHKFIAPVSILPELLNEMSPLFRVQSINNIKIAPYTTQYFDTSDMNFFLMHQNGKLNRQKIRIRSYVDSNLSFLEIKNKNNKGRTKKVRIPTENSQINSITELNGEQTFLGEHSLFDINSLTPILKNSFKRITLVNNRKTERITIDLDLSFFNTKTNLEKSLKDIMILELKQDGWKHSDFRDILTQLRIKRASFSKYCIGIVATDPAIKYNRFKRKLIKINKLIQNDSI